MGIVIGGKRKDNGEWVYGAYFYIRHNDGRNHTHHLIIPNGVDMSRGTPIERIQVEVIPETMGIFSWDGNTEPEEMLMVSANRVKAYKENVDRHHQEAYSAFWVGQKTAINELFGDKCQPVMFQDTGFGGMNLNPPAYKLDVETDKELEHRLEQSSVQVEPKFKVGDIVRVKYPKIYKGEIGIIDEIGSRIIEYHLQGNKTLENVCFAEDALEPYTEPETKDMEEKELNLCELLKGCEGEEFYTPLCGNITFSHIESNTSYPILCYKGDKNVCFTLDGNFYNDYIGKCLIYPSRALYEKYPLDAKKAWNEWASERKPKYILQAEIRLISNDGKTIEDYENVEVEVSDVDLTQAAEVVKNTLMKFHENFSAQNLDNPK